MIEKKIIKDRIVNVILVSVIQQGVSEHKALEYLNELSFLAETAGCKTVKTFIQKMKSPDSKTFVGKGKLQEIKEYAAKKNVEMIIFDDELTGAQISNIESETKIFTLDRSDLILDIFASRAKTAQAKVQVELAQYQYILPRLKGMWKHLERQGGGIGSRGPGETEIETDRRIVKDKISLLKKRLKEIDKQAFTQRKDRGEFIRVALVGYTNVGKSTIMNLLGKSEVFAENKLFATLDTTTRKVVLGHTPFLLSDTVGFIRKLPHHLIESFKSTLDEVHEADLLLHVVDISHPHFEEQLDVVNKTLHELDSLDKPVIIVFNKMDEYERNTYDEWLDPEVKEQLLIELQQKWMHKNNGRCVFISATHKTNIPELRQMILNNVRTLYQQKYPYKTEFFY